MGTIVLTKQTNRINLRVKRNKTIASALCTMTATCRALISPDVPEL